MSSGSIDLGGNVSTTSGSVNDVTASSPLSSSGGATPDISFLNQNANTVLSGPTSGGANAPAFRALVAGDIPSLPYLSTSLTSNHLFVGNGSNIATNVALSGDATLANTGALTLATVNSNVGSLGDASHVASITLNAKGLATAASSVSIQIAESQVTNLVSDLAAKANIITPSSNQLVYVNYLTGNDSTGNGSYEFPYKTVAFAMTTITDSSQNKPYSVMVLADRQIETTDILMKPYTFIIGSMQRASYLRINGGGAIKPDTSAGSGTSWMGLNNIYIGGSTPINWDLQALGGSDNDFVLSNCTLTGTFTYKGRNGGGGDFLEMYVGILLGTAVLDSVNSQIQNFAFSNTFTLTNTQSITGLSATYINDTFSGNVSITSSGTQEFINANYDTGVTFTTVGTNTILSYRGLPPTSKQTISGGTTVTYLDDATMIPYTPASAGKWASPVPTNLQNAVDRIAAVVGNVTPIP